MVRNYIRKTEERWSKEHLLAALVELKDQKIRFKDASKKYGISRATLYRNLEKFIAGGATLDPDQFKTSGGNPILTKVEEAVLEKTINDLSEQGYEITSVDVKRICFEYCVANSIPNRFNQVKGMASDDWFYGFIRRHPNVAVTRKIKVGGLPKAETEEDKSESGIEAIIAAPSKRKSPSSSRLNADAKKEEHGSPKLIAPEGNEVVCKKVNGAKRLKLDANAAGTEGTETWRSRRTRSVAVVAEDNENEVFGNGEGKEDQKMGVEFEIEIDTNGLEAKE